MSFLRGFSIAMGANIIIFVLSFLSRKLLFVYLSEEDNGSYYLIMRYAYLVMLCFGDWLRLSNMNIAGKDLKLSGKLITNLLYYIAVITPLLFAAFIFIPPNMLENAGLTTRIATAAGIIGILFIVRGCCQSLLLVNNRMIQYGITNVLWSGSMLLLNLILIVFMGKGSGGMICALIIATTVAAAWALCNSIRTMGISLVPTPACLYSAGLLGSRSLIALMGTYIMINIHGLILKPLSSSSGEGEIMLGMFAVGFSIYQLFQRMSDVTGNLIFSHVAQQKKQAGANLTAIVHRNTLVVFCAGTLGAFVLGKYLIYFIADRKYIDALIPFYIMLPGIVCYNMGLVINSSYWGRGYPLRIILAPYVFGLAGIAMNAAFVPLWGVSGTAAAFTLTSIPWYGYLLMVFHHDFGIPYRTCLVPAVSDFKRYYQRFKDRRS